MVVQQQAAGTVVNSLAHIRILVTGGAGFIGSELTRQLVDQGADITVVDNLVNGRRENLGEIISDRCKLVVCDVRDEARMAELMQSIDLVFHLACLGVRHSIHSPGENHAVNATATLNLLISARKRGVSRFIYVSSSEVYGTAHQVPMNEEHPTFPMTVYGASKLAGECYTRAYFTTYGLPTAIVRPFNTFGPRCHHEGDSGEVIPRFLLSAMIDKPMIIFGDGTQTRDFTYVSDTARGILAMALTDEVIGETVNLGNGRETTINDVAHNVRSVLNKPQASIIYEQARPGDVLRHFADTTKAQHVLRYAPAVSFSQGLLNLKSWYDQSAHDPQTLYRDIVTRNWEAS